MKRLIQFFSLIAVLMLVIPLTQAATYKWTDKDGNTVYSQNPPPDGNYERMNIKTSPSSGTDSAQGSDEQPSAADSILQDAEDANKQKEIQAEQAKAAEIRKKNCEVAKHNLQIYTVYRRIKDDKGNVTRMDDNERMKKIQEAKDQIAEFCD
jgi:hypothetical protein